MTYSFQLRMPSEHRIALVQPGKDVLTWTDASRGLYPTPKCPRLNHGHPRFIHGIEHVHRPASLSSLVRGDDGSGDAGAVTQVMAVGPGPSTDSNALILGARD